MDSEILCRICLPFGLFVLLSIQEVTLHPQCLDSRPPFDAEAELSFCPQYPKFGCCTPNDENGIRLKYERLRARIPAARSSQWAQCSSYVKLFLCQECSPYAAHIFDAEKPNQAQVIPRKFPGLCTDYCTTFYDKCREFVEYFFEEPSDEKTTLTEAITQSSYQFCKAVNLTDYDYCYPNLLTNPILTGNITIEAITQDGCLCVEKFENTHLRNPIFAKHANDGTNRLFIGEQIGLIHIFYPDGTNLSEPFLNITEHIVTTSRRGDERGLLGLAFHPNFSTNGLFYLYFSTYTSATYIDEYGYPRYYNHKIVVNEYAVSPYDKNKADPSYVRQIIEVQQPYSNHNGGEIFFGPDPDDNYLYLFVGDGGKGGDPLQAGQNLTMLLGKVLRIDINYVTPTTNYAIPPDNPYLTPLEDGTVPRPEIYAYGVRNIWRCGMDRGDPVTGYGYGRVICGDVGQSAVEELDLLEKGANYGWNNKEGTHDYCTGCPTVSVGKLVDPIFEYTHKSGYGKSITGGNFYRGCHSPNLNGMYFFGDFMTGRLFRLKENQTTGNWDHKEVTMCGDFSCNGLLSNKYVPRIISFGEDEDGEVYMLSSNDPSTAAPVGEVYRLVDPFRRGNPATCRSARPGQDKPTAAPTATPPPTTTTTTPRPTVARTTEKVSGTSAIQPVGMLITMVTAVIMSLW